MITRRGLLVAGAGIGLTTAGAPSRGDSAERDKWRVFDAPTGKEWKWPELTRRLSDVRVVFVGEQHDDGQTHRAEAALLEAVYQKAGQNLTFALEMFERDQQAPLDAYLASKISEAELAKQIKLWPNYATDYRPLIAFAKSHQIPVVASNAPARLVRRVGKEGLAGVMASLPSDDKPLIASVVHAPPLASGDEYARRFANVMGGGHGGAPGSLSPETVHKIYEAQCVRDDTMAESVARLREAGRTVFHLSGGFHVEGGLGTVQRFLWRRPLDAQTVRVLQIVPVKNDPTPSQNKTEADFLLYVPDTRFPAKDKL